MKFLVFLNLLLLATFGASYWHLHQRQSALAAELGSPNRGSDIQEALSKVADHLRMEGKVEQMRGQDLLDYQNALQRDLEFLSVQLSSKGIFWHPTR